MSVLSQNKVNLICSEHKGNATCICDDIRKTEQATLNAVIEMIEKEIKGLESDINLHTVFRFDEYRKRKERIMIALTSLANKLKGNDYEG